MKNTLKDLPDGIIAGIIGSASPQEPYLSNMGCIAGFIAAKHLHSKGYLFTGGVGGVGVDAYMGAMMFGMQLKSGNPGLNFFTLIPHSVLIPKHAHQSKVHKEMEYLSIPYNLPSEYASVGRMFGEPTKIVRAGESMEERRQFVANIANVLIVLNGGGGTLDEAVSAMNINVPVLAVRNSGGAAELLCMKKMGHTEPVFDFNLYESSAEFIADKTVNTQSLHVIDDVWQLEECLKLLIK